MAEKSISVRLSARVEQYISAMKAAEASTTGLSRSSIRAINQLGGSLQTMGRSMTRYVTVPIVALGAGAVLMASNFETSFAQMVGLANVPASEVDHLREAVLSLAGETARSPQELADALYLAASSGLDSAAALDVVTMAAHGAAAGMGSTTDVTNLLTGAVGSYGSANLTAAQAADFLSATIREGRAAPEELATTMGRILPIAAAMGVGMGEVGGALAFLTNTGLETDQAVTGLRDALMKLATPGAKARQALHDMGTSSDELKQAIAKDGLMGALELLREHGFNGNLEAMHALLPEVRGYNALTSLMADNTGTLDQIMGRVTDSAGSMGLAFNAVASTDAFKMKQALADIKVAMIQVGDVLLPIVAEAASAIGDLAKWFGDLPTPVLAAVAAMAGLAATAGPLVIIAGTLLKNWQLVTRALSATAGLTTAATAIGAIGLAITAGFIIYEHFTAHQREVRARTDEVSVALSGATGQALDYANELATSSTSVSGFTTAQRALSMALASTGEDGVALTQALGTLGLQTSDAYEILSNISANGGDGLADIAHQAGFATDEVAILVLAAQQIGDDWPLAGARATGAMQNIADQFGTTLPRVQEVVGANADVISSLRVLDGQANGVHLNELSQGFLRTAASTSTAGENFVELAEAMSGADRNGVDAAKVYAELLDIVSGLPGPQEAAARTALGLGEAVDGSGDAINRNSALITDYTDIILGVNAVSESSTETFAGYAEALFGIAPAAGAASTGVELLGKELGTVDTRFKSTADSIEYLYKVLGTGTQAPKALADTFDYLNKNLGVSVNIAKTVATSLSEIFKSGDFSKLDAGPATQQLEELGHIADDTADRFNFLQDAANMLRDAFDMVTTPADDLRAATRGVYEEFENMLGALDDNSTALNAMGDDWDVSTEEGRNLQEQTERTRDAILEHASAMLENGSSAEAAAADVAYNVTQLNDQWRAAGLTEEQIAALNYQYGLTPAQVATALKTYGIEKANAIIDDYNKKIGEIPDSASTTVTATASGLYGIEGKIANLARPRTVPITPVLTKTALYVEIHASGTGYLKSAVGRYVAAGSNLMTTVAEPGAGDEVILPLDNKARMSRLLGMAEVGPRVAAAMGGGGSAPMAAVGGMTTVGGDIYMTVNMQPGADGNDVVRELRKVQRRSGPLPLTVR